MTNYCFQKHQHLQSSKQFERVYHRRCRASDHRLLIFAATNDEDFTRIGLSVSKKHGNAVKRSRIRRLLREAFRLTQSDLPTGLDLVLIPRQGAELTIGGFQKSLRHVTARLAKKLGQQELK